VQFIKWVQAEVGRGTYVVRAPRLPLDAREIESVKGILAQALKARPPVRR
jgi:4-hydroxy-tetrahydrodipicolinate synthase